MLGDVLSASPPSLFRATRVLGVFRRWCSEARTPGARDRRLAAIVSVGMALLVSSCASSPSRSTGARESASTPGLGDTSTSSAPVATTVAASTPTVAAGKPGRSGTQGSGCRSGNPLAGVYHPYRLQVRSACDAVVGTVSLIRHEADGDVHFNLALSSSEAGLLDHANYSYEDGELVAEIVPADQPGCTPGQPPFLPPTAYRSAGYNYGLCTGADLATPPQGAEVRITGPYVLDRDHGWMEIHPVWSITIVGRGPTTSKAQTPPPTQASVGSSVPHGDGGPWCGATASPSNDGYSGDYQVHVRSNEPYTEATASDPGDTWSDRTDGSGNADIRLYDTVPGDRITVTVGPSSCTATA